MPNLPFDCIVNVINQIDCRHDLFMLLTVSRDVFQVAVRRLYRDPLHRDWGFNRHQYDRRFFKLLRLLLSLSPANDHQTNDLRQAVNQIDTQIDATTTLSPTTTTTTTTMLDYLSLVKVVHWGALLGNSMFSIDIAEEGSRSGDIISTLTWAFVGHRLEEVVELDIVDIHLRDDDDIQRYGQFGQGGRNNGLGEEEDAGHPPAHNHRVCRQRGDDRYLRHVSRMTSLRKIWICCGDYWNRDWNRFYNRAEKMVLAMQREHGPQQLQECRLSPSPLENGPTVEDAKGSMILDISGAQRIYSLVSTATGGLARNQYPTNSLLVVPCSDGSFVALDRLFDPELARVELKTVPGGDPSTGRGFHSELITRRYSDLSDPQILQRCRGLTTLNLYLSAGYDHCLAWAAYEAEYRRRMCPDGTRPLFLSATTASAPSSTTTATTATMTTTLPKCNVVVAPLVPLRDLNLQFGSGDLNSTPKPLLDGLCGFSKTLEWLTIKYSSPSAPDRPVSERQQQGPRVLRSPVPLPQLKYLTLTDIEIDPTFWKLAPFVEDVQLSVMPTDFILGSASSPFESPQKTTTTMSTSSTSAGCNTTDLNSLKLAAAEPAPLADIVLECLLLEKLKLEGGAVHRFDPDSFNTNGQCLKELDLFVLCPSSGYYPEDQGDHHRYSNAVYYCRNCCVFASADSVATVGAEGGEHSGNGNLYVRHPDRWTWDWHLPQLTHLQVHGDLLALRFDFVSLLRSCPSLIDINLGHAAERRQGYGSFPLAVKNQILSTAVAVEADAGAGTHTYATSPSSSSPPSSLLSAPNMQSLSLSGKWLIPADELACLLDVLLPGLRRLDLYNNLMNFMIDEHGMTDCRGVVRLTRDHPALRFCRVQVLDGFKEMSEQQQGEQDPKQQAQQWLDEQLEPMGLTQCDDWDIYQHENTEVDGNRKIIYMFWDFAYKLQEA